MGDVLNWGQGFANGAFNLSEAGMGFRIAHSSIEMRPASRLSTR